MIIAGLTAMFFVLPPHDISVRGATTDQFGYYKQITLNSSQVPSTLTNFPVLINITDTDLRDNCLSSGWDIAFFNATNVQLNHEIELWTNTTGRLVAWVNVTTLSSSVNTIIYMYYGDSDIGASAENVAGTWDSNYIGVWHMNSSTATEYDSTNSYDGTKKGATEPAQGTGKIGYGQIFDGSNDYINMGYDSGLRATTMTIEAWAETDDYTHGTGSLELVTKDDEWYFLMDGATPGKFCYNPHGATPKATSTTVAVNNTWYYIVGVYSGSNGKLYSNGSLESTQSNTAPPQDGHDFVIGAHGDGNNGGTPNSAFWIGTLDEVRYSNIERNVSWIKTTYNNVNNATSGGFFTFGSQEGDSGQYEISGLDANTRFPFSGEAGETVWSTGNITMNIYTNVSLVSDNCTDIFLDFADIDADIVQENFSLAIINTSDGSWDNISAVLQVSAVDGNMTFNATTWATGIIAGWADGTSPFPIVDYNSTLAVRIRVSIPADKTAGSYTTDSWNVLWKVTT